MVSPDDYNGNYADHRLEQYKLYVEMADRVSARRQTANTYFLSINTAIFTVIGYVHVSRSGNLPTGGMLIIALVGPVLCYSWYRLIRSYRDLSRGKFEVIRRLEGDLPLAPYDSEWRLLGQGHDPSKYLPFTHIESRVPWILFGLYVGIGLWVLGSHVIS